MLTYVGFRAHVKIASRIVSCRNGFETAHFYYPVNSQNYALASPWIHLWAYTRPTPKEIVVSTVVFYLSFIDFVGFPRWKMYLAGLSASFAVFWVIEQTTVERTRSSAIAEGPCDAPCQLWTGGFCHRPHYPAEGIMRSFTGSWP